MSHLKNKVTKSEIRSARRIPLAPFIERYHMDAFRRSGSSLYLEANKSLYIRDGHTGYTDFSTGSHGNSIDFLVKHLGYGFVEAVSALNGHCSCPASGSSVIHASPGPSSPARQVALPDAADKPYRRMYAYLKKRGIPAGVTTWMEDCGLAYQEKEHGNIVFVNTQKDYCELRGTLTYTDRPFHGCLKSAPDRFWGISSGPGRIQKAYICEAVLVCCKIKVQKVAEQKCRKLQLHFTSFCRA